MLQEYETACFFAGHQEAAALYEILQARLESALQTRGCALQVRVQRTQISLRGDRHLFCCVSLPRSKKGGEVLRVTFSLPMRVDAARIAAAVEPYPGRWTHHVPLFCAADVDEALLQWLLQAYAFSQVK